MAYIGKQPVIGNFVKLDAISVVNGQASYTMQNGGVNFTSYDNVNQFLVSLNGILQSPTDSFTVSGSTITFASALSTGDVIDFVMILGNVLDLGVPSDNTVSLAKLTATGTKDATTFLRGDNTFAEAGGGKVLQYQSAQITTNLSTTSTSYVDVTGLSVSITPASTSNKILILFTGIVGNSGSTSNTFVTCLRGSTNLASDTNNYFFFNSAGTRIYAGSSLHFIDEPNTTSATTYKIQYRVDGDTGHIQDKARITLMELSV